MTFPPRAERAGRVAWQIARTVLLAYLAAACSTWTGRPAPASATLDPPPPTRFRVTLASGTMIELRDAVVGPDSVLGISEVTGAHVGIPADSVRGIEVRSVDALRTVGLMAGIAATVFVVLVAAYVYAWDHNADF